VFGISEEPNPFVVDSADLKKKFRAAQAWVHPDVWASRSPVRFSMNLQELLFLFCRGNKISPTRCLLG
jgi:hypothetical protein